MACVAESKHISEEKRVKRDGGLTAAIVGAAISSGASLVGTTVGALQRPDYSVSVSGSLENYSKWPLHFKGCEMASGYMNVPMRSVASGLREGFASHKTSDSATGSWIKCAFTVNNVMVHFMYSAPYSFDFHSNTLAFGVCPPHDHSCSGFTASSMYYGSSSYLARREYYYSVKTLKKCFMGICITGVMGTNHHPEIDMKVMPESYDDLCNVAKDASLKDRWNKSEYENFVKAQ